MSDTMKTLLEKLKQQPIFDKRSNQEIIDELESKEKCIITREGFKTFLYENKEEIKTDFKAENGYGQPLWYFGYNGKYFKIPLPGFFDISLSTYTIQRLDKEQYEEEIKNWNYQKKVNYSPT